MNGTVRAIQAAAVERAMADGTVARDHLALVGALEPARRAGGRDPLAATATALLAVRAIDSGIPDGPIVPGEDPNPAVRGAAIAYRRFGVAADRAADLAGVPVGTVLTALD